jgi:RNA recognition motif-containing protein
MGTKLYVGNLNYRTTDQSLAAAFAAAGFAPTSVQVIMDRETGRSRGFAFVEMGTPQEASQALEGMQDQDVEGRRLNVTLARERERSPMGPRTGPRIGPPVNQNRPRGGARPAFGGEPSYRPSRPPQDFSRPAFPSHRMDPQPHPDLIDPTAVKEGRRRERREYKGHSRHERDDDDDDY